MSFVPAASVVEGADGRRENTAYVLHGIMGSQRNWRGFGRRLAERFPRWRFVLTDLRNHGDSGPAPAPHDLEACAADLARLASRHGRPRVVLGHSFGGKVALTFARDVADDLESVWVLDCPTGPEVAPEASEVARIVEALETIPLPVGRRQEAMRRLEALGFGPGISGWMATNLRHDPAGGFRWHFDLDGVRRMLDHYWIADLHPFLEDPPESLRIHVLQALESDRWRPEELRFLRARHAAGTLRLHSLPDAGHWCHIDAPEALLETLALTFDAA